MIKNPTFDDIRPYYDEEIPAAMQRIADSGFFPILASYVYPGQDMEKIRAMLKSFKTIADFQLEVMRCVNEQVVARSSTEFTFSGIEQIKPGQQYLFISNHRDIVLDSCLLQYILYQSGHDTTEITFGSNLMSSPLIVDIGKSNKMFRVERSGNMKDFYKSSQHLSDYIRYVLTEKHQSIWIAQRNGRTKDGNDVTDRGIIKMFCMSNPLEKINALAELNIVPVSVSYEWEPCDILKTLELYESRQTKYIKKPGEDINSIMTGIFQQKGKIHISICQPVTRNDLMAYDSCTHNEYHKKVAELIDYRIYSSYNLTSNNYIAHDLRYGKETYINLYTEVQKKAFFERVKNLDKYDVAEPEVLKDIFLGIYSNPIENKLNVRKKITRGRH